MANNDEISLLLADVSTTLRDVRLLLQLLIAIIILVFFSFADQLTRMVLIAPMIAYVLHLLETYVLRG